MARKKTPAEVAAAKNSLGARLAIIRDELFGARGGPEMARRLGIPVRSWYNYEEGITVPGEVILRFMELTAVEPMWLLHGREPKFRRGGSLGLSTGETGPAPVQSLLLAALELLESGAAAESAMVMGGDWVTVAGDAMAPIICEGATVGFSPDEETPEELHGKIVVAEVDGQKLVRWFRHLGQFACLSPHKPRSNSPEIIIDLSDAAAKPWLRRVVSINTPGP